MPVFSHSIDFVLTCLISVKKISVSFNEIKDVQCLSKKILQNARSKMRSNFVYKRKSRFEFVLRYKVLIFQLLFYQLFDCPITNLSH